MKIGLDISAIQTPHRMRGIGATVINFVNNLSDSARKEHEFVLYLLPEAQTEALALLDLQNLNYTVSTITPPKRIKLRLPGPLRYINTALNAGRILWRSRYGDPRINIQDVDVYLQFDQMQPLPSTAPNTKIAVILYDLIPYVMEAEYLHSYRTARVHGSSRLSSLRQSLLRKRYIGQLKIAGKRADLLLAISEHTKQDFLRYTATPGSKVLVTHLGFSGTHTGVDSAASFKRYLPNSWGYFVHDVDLTKKPFLLYIGGADSRRRLIDLASAYNHLKSEGHDIMLVLAGDSMKGPGTLPEPLHSYLQHSSYLDDIVFLGFVSDEHREWLYAHALALVYPSTYEGFGLPVLEAMAHSTPVITYRNTSIHEVAGEAVLYASDDASIQSAALTLLQSKETVRKYKEAGKQRAAGFTWAKTVDTILKAISR